MADNDPTSLLATQSDPGGTWVTDRLKFFNEEFLTSQDFIDDQLYHIVQRRRGDRLLRVAGVAEGFLVSPANNKPDSVSVGQGTAYDLYGNQIVLALDTIVPIEKGMTGQQVLYVSFQEMPEGNAQVGNGKGVAGSNRWRQVPRFAFTRLTQTDGSIALATFTISNNAVTAIVDARQFTGINLPTSTGAVLTLNASANSSFKDWAELSGNLHLLKQETVDGLLTANNGLTVNKPLTANNDVTVGGGLTVTAGGLSVTGDTKLTGKVTASDHLKVTAGGLEVAGAGVTTLSNTLTVSAGGLTVSAGGLNVTGDTKFTGKVTASDHLKVSAGGLEVAGATTMAANLTITAGGLNVTGGDTSVVKLTVTNHLIVSAGGLDVTGAATLNSGLTVPGLITAGNLIVTGDGHANITVGGVFGGVVPVGAIVIWTPNDGRGNPINIPLGWIPSGPVGNGWNYITKTSI